MLPVYVGIDLACAKNKRLPICLVSEEERLVPLQIPTNVRDLLPRGLGNREIASENPFHVSAERVACALKQLEHEKGWRIERIAIDAPAAPPTSGSRLCELELFKKGLSVFKTPIESDWTTIRNQCVEHLNMRRSESTLPFANKIWMAYGFKLFSGLRASFCCEVIEVYPYAIVRRLLSDVEHKSARTGYADQLAVIAHHTRWDKPDELARRLQEVVPGVKPHDRLDAFMAAWIATLPAHGRRAYGDPQDANDSIWIPH